MPRSRRLTTASTRRAAAAAALSLRWPAKVSRRCDASNRSTGHCHLRITHMDGGADAPDGEGSRRQWRSLLVTAMCSAAAAAVRRRALGRGSTLAMEGLWETMEEPRSMKALTSDPRARPFHGSMGFVKESDPCKTESNPFMT